jgi:hypothetical protein
MVPIKYDNVPNLCCVVNYNKIVHVNWNMENHLEK